MVINKAPDKNGRNILGRLGRYASHSELTRKKNKRQTFYKKLEHLILRIQKQISPIPA